MSEEQWTEETLTAHIIAMEQEIKRLKKKRGQMRFYKTWNDPERQAYRKDMAAARDAIDAERIARGETWEQWSDRVFDESKKS